jgi:hypothetical protein
MMRTIKKTLLSPTDDIGDDILEAIAKHTGITNKQLLLLSSIARTIAVGTTVLFGLRFTETEVW